MNKAEIPRKTVYRLSVYYRVLLALKNIDTVSSEALATAAGVKSTQLRKDLAYFGQLGTRGLGYSVPALTARLSEVLGAARLQPVILVGAGHLGSALLRYGGFAKEGFEVVAAFDLDASRERARDLSIPVYSMENLPAFITEKKIKLAILTVPGAVAQEVCNNLIKSGVQAILNFAPVVLHTPEQIVVKNVDLAIELENLSYFIR